MPNYDKETDLWIEFAKWRPSASIQRDAGYNSPPQDSGILETHLQGFLNFAESPWHGSASNTMNNVCLASARGSGVAFHKLSLSHLMNQIGLASGGSECELLSLIHI